MPDTPTAQIVTDEERHRAAERSCWERQIRVARWLNGITAGAAIVGLMGLFFVYLGIVHADQATIDANRAWLEPVIMGTAKPKIGEALNFVIRYRNTGRSPAIGLHWKFDAGYFETPPDDNGDLIQIDTNNTCDGLFPYERGGIEYPARQISVPGEIPHIISGSSEHNGTAIVADERMISDKHRFFVRGCVAYNTMETIGYSSFCFYLRPGDAIGACPSGNGAK